MKKPVGPSHLSKVLELVKSEPKLPLFGVRSLRLSYAYKNDHFGARHFVKEELPKLRFANPNLKIEVERVLKTKSEHWRPELELQLDNGTSKTINMQDKWSTTILRELLELSGGEPWKNWKRVASERGIPALPDEGRAADYVPPNRGAVVFPNLKEWRETAPARALAQQKVEKERKERKEVQQQAKAKKKVTEEPVAELPAEVLENLKTKTGAAAILP